MATVITFLLGMGNFAWHRAVVESGHRMIVGMPPDALRMARFASLALEFLLLCGALYAAELGHTHWLWAYCGYSVFNGVAAWLVVSGRV